MNTFIHPSVVSQTHSTSLRSQVLIQPSRLASPSASSACPAESVPAGVECSVAAKGPWPFKLDKQPSKTSSAAVSRCAWDGNSLGNTKDSGAMSCYKLSSNVVRVRSGSSVMKFTGVSEMETVREQLV